MGNIVKLPTAATTYYTIQRFGKSWGKVLVTPTEAKALRYAKDYAARYGADLHSAEVIPLRKAVA